jgi:hypothetical protein
MNAMQHQHSEGITIMQLKPGQTAYTTAWAAKFYEGYGFMIHADYSLNIESGGTVVVPIRQSGNEYQFDPAPMVAYITDVNSHLKGQTLRETFTMYVHQGLRIPDATMIVLHPVDFATGLPYDWNNSMQLRGGK